MKYLSAIPLLIILVLNSTAYTAVQESASTHIEKGNQYLVEDRLFAAIEEFRAAISLGAKSPVLFRNLAIVLYDLGFLDEAELQMQKALAQSPYAVMFRMELGIMYMAQGMNELAEEQFLIVLDKNPGYSDAYYYLGEKYFRQKEYKMAWAFAKMARKLGHRGSALTVKLSKASTEPDVRPWEYFGKSIFIRQILVGSRDRAEEIVSRIKKGELFEDIAADLDRHINSAGGFLGHFKESELQPAIASVIRDQNLFAVPIIVKTELGYHIVQRIVPFDLAQWKKAVAYASSKDTSFPGSPENDGIVLVHAPAPGPAVQQTANLQKEDKRSGDSKLADSMPEKKYPVYAGVFRLKKYAIERLDRLKDIGLDGFSYMRKTKRGLLHVVVAGRYASLREAERVGKMIADHGLEYYIPR